MRHTWFLIPRRLRHKLFQEIEDKEEFFACFSCVFNPSNQNHRRTISPHAFFPNNFQRFVDRILLNFLETCNRQLYFYTSTAPKHAPFQTQKHTHTSSILLTGGCLIGGQVLKVTKYDSWTWVKADPRKRLRMALKLSIHVKYWCN